MSLCPSCGNNDAAGFCAHHHASVPGDPWADGNRAACAFFHRGELRPVTPDDHFSEEVETMASAWTSRPRRRAVA